MPTLALILLLLADLPFSLEPGTSWEYREAYTEHLGDLDSTTDDVTRFEVRGTAGHLVLRQSGGPDPSTAPIERTEGWLRFGVFTGEEVLPLPLEADPNRQEAEPRAFAVEGEEVLTVPAGQYLVLRCTLRTPTSLSILWIAPGVGVVRQVEGRPGARPDLERVLLRWTDAH